MTMNLKNRPPIFVPARFRVEMERLSKAALMDIAWDRADIATGTAGADDDAAMREFREHRDIILAHRIERLA